MKEAGGHNYQIWFGTFSVLRGRLHVGALTIILRSGSSLIVKIMLFRVSDECKVSFTKCILSRLEEARSYEQRVLRRII